MNANNLTNLSNAQADVPGAHANQVQIIDLTNTAVQPNNMNVFPPAQNVIPIPSSNQSSKSNNADQTSIQNSGVLILEKKDQGSNDQSLNPTAVQSQMLTQQNQFRETNYLQLLNQTQSQNQYLLNSQKVVEKNANVNVAKDFDQNADMHNDDGYQDEKFEFDDDNRNTDVQEVLAANQVSMNRISEKNGKNGGPINNDIQQTQIFSDQQNNQINQGIDINDLQVQEGFYQSPIQNEINTIQKKRCHTQYSNIERSSSTQITTKLELRYKQYYDEYLKNPENYPLPTCDEMDFLLNGNSNPVYHISFLKHLSNHIKNQFIHQAQYKPNQTKLGNVFHLCFKSHEGNGHIQNQKQNIITRHSRYYHQKLFDIKNVRSTSVQSLKQNILQTTVDEKTPSQTEKITLKDYVHKEILSFIEEHQTDLEARFEELQKQISEQQTNQSQSNKNDNKNKIKIVEEANEFKALQTVMLIIQLEKIFLKKARLDIRRQEKEEKQQNKAIDVQNQNQNIKFFDVFIKKESPKQIRDRYFLEKEEKERKIEEHLDKQRLTFARQISCLFKLYNQSNDSRKEKKSFKPYFKAFRNYIDPNLQSTIYLHNVYNMTYRDILGFPKMHISIDQYRKSKNFQNQNVDVKKEKISSSSSSDKIVPKSRDHSQEDQNQNLLDHNDNQQQQQANQIFQENQQLSTIPIKNKSQHQNVSVAQIQKSKNKYDKELKDKEKLQEKYQGLSNQKQIYPNNVNLTLSEIVKPQNQNIFVDHTTNPDGSEKVSITILKDKANRKNKQNSSAGKNQKTKHIRFEQELHQDQRNASQNQKNSINKKRENKNSFKDMSQNNSRYSQKQNFQSQSQDLSQNDQMFLNKEPRNQTIATQINASQEQFQQEQDQQEIIPKEDDNDNDNQNQQIGEVQNQDNPTYENLFQKFKPLMHFSFRRDKGTQQLYMISRNSLRAAFNEYSKPSSLVNLVLHFSHQIVDPAMKSDVLILGLTIRCGSLLKKYLGNAFLQTFGRKEQVQEVILPEKEKCKNSKNSINMLLGPDLCAILKKHNLTCSLIGGKFIVPKIQFGNQINLRMFNLAACYLFQKHFLQLLKLQDNRDLLCIEEKPAFYAFGDEVGRFSGDSKDIETCGGLINYREWIRDGDYQQQLIDTNNRCFDQTKQTDLPVLIVDVIYNEKDQSRVLNKREIDDDMPAYKIKASFKAIQSALNHQQLDQEIDRQIRNQLKLISQIQNNSVSFVNYPNPPDFVSRPKILSLVHKYFQAEMDKHNNKTKKDGFGKDITRATTIQDFSVKSETEDQLRSKEQFQKFINCLDQNVRTQIQNQIQRGQNDQEQIQDQMFIIDTEQFGAATQNFKPINQFERNPDGLIDKIKKSHLDFKKQFIPKNANDVLPFTKSIARQFIEGKISSTSDSDSSKEKILKKDKKSKMKESIAEIKKDEQLIEPDDSSQAADENYEPNENKKDKKKKNQKSQSKSQKKGKKKSSKKIIKSDPKESENKQIVGSQGFGQIQQQSNEQLLFKNGDSDNSDDQNQSNPFSSQKQRALDIQNQPVASRAQERQSTVVKSMTKDVWKDSLLNIKENVTRGYVDLKKNDLDKVLKTQQFKNVANGLSQFQKMVDYDQRLIHHEDDYEKHAQSILEGSLLEQRMNFYPDSCGRKNFHSVLFKKDSKGKLKGYYCLDRRFEWEINFDGIHDGVGGNQQIVIDGNMSDSNAKNLIKQNDSEKKTFVQDDKRSNEDMKNEGEEGEQEGQEGNFERDDDN